MQPRTRRPHGIRSRKISVSVSEDDLEVLSRQAARLYRGNVSAVVHDMVATLKREQAADELLRLLGGGGVTDADVQALRDEVAALPARARRRRVA